MPFPLFFKTRAGRTAISGLLLFCLACFSFGPAQAAGETNQRGAERSAIDESKGSNRNFEENALKRCRIFIGDDHAECERRIAHGPIAGSVKGGGVLYENITRESPPQNL